MPLSYEDEAKLKGLIAQRDHLLQLKQQLDTQRIQNEPGLEDVSLTPITKPMLQKEGEQSQREYEQMGHPTIGKMVNAGVSNLPEIASMLLPLGEGASAAERTGAGLKKAADVAFAPLEATGKEAMGAAEKAAGVSVAPFKSSDLPKTASEAIDFSESLSKLAEQTPEKINQVMEPQGINQLRKIIEYTLDNFKENLPGTNLKAISKAKAVLTKALDQALPELAGPRQALANTFTRQAILDKIPGLAKTAKKAAIVGGF